MRSLFVLLVLSCIFALSAADYVAEPYPGVYADSRFGGEAVLCCVNDRMQGTASGQLLFVDNSNSTGEDACTRATLQGHYWATGPRKGGEVGTYKLKLDLETGNYVGWFYPGGKEAAAWPWTLTKGAGVVPSDYCLASSATGVDSITGRWTIGSNLWKIHICAKDVNNADQKSFTEGTIFNDQDAVAYIRGYSYLNNHIFIGRQYNIAGADQSDETCSDFGNALYRVVEDADGNTLLQGFVTRGNIGAASPQVQFVSAAQDSTTLDTATCDDGKDLLKCESGPYYPLLRSSASAVVSSIVGVLVLSIAALMF